MKIKLGGWAFRIKNKWQEVTFEEAAKLYESKTIRERVSILMRPRLPDTLKVSDAHLLSLYEIVSFIEEIPELVPNTCEVPEAPKWSFRAFNACRDAITRHEDCLPLAFSQITEELRGDLERSGKDPDVLPLDSFVEIGAKGLDSLQKFVESWRPWGIFDVNEPTAEEVAAGVERLQSFGVYGMVNKLAEHFGKLPEEIEARPVGSVFMDWTYLIEQAGYQSRLQEQKG